MYFCCFPFSDFPFLPCLQVLLLNKTDYDLQEHVAATLLPGCTLTTDGDSTMLPLSLPPPYRPLRLKLKVQSTQACLEFHGYNFPLRGALDNCEHPIGPDLIFLIPYPSPVPFASSGGGYLDKDDNLVDKGHGPYVRWTCLLDGPALLEHMELVLQGTYVPMEIVGDAVPDTWVFPPNVILQ